MDFKITLLAEIASLKKDFFLANEIRMHQFDKWRLVNLAESHYMIHLSLNIRILAKIWQ